MPTRSKLDARKMMELAVKVMLESVCEPRDDSKSVPRVGAVLVKPDGVIETGCRGELREGDHAEFALLERKNRSVRLDGSVLFTTLEPCSPGSRHPPKISCAERIVLARIKEVWIGIEDPDPTVDRKGIKYLQDHGVKVNMFDRDLQDEIRSKNKEFIAQALERAAEAKEPPKPIELSTLESGAPTAVTADLDAEALKLYRLRAKIPAAVGSDEFNHRLALQGILAESDGKLRPTGFGLLLFGREPRLSMPQAGLLATIRFPGGGDETRDFDGPAVLIPEQIEKWLRDKLPSVIDRSQMQRKQVPALPFELVREAVVNALVHRDYGIEGGKCQLTVTPDTVTVKSPGAPVPPITLEQMQAFNAPMLSRNPQFHYVFARMELAEELGLGLRSMKQQSEKLGLPLPRYGFDAPYVVLTLFRSGVGAVQALPEKMLAQLSKDERAGWQFISALTTVTSVQYAKGMKYTDRQARRHLKRFAALGLLHRIGAGPQTKYHVLRP